MPITSSAKKALRRDKRRQAVNYRVRSNVKKAIDNIRKGSNDPKDVSTMHSTLDKAGKLRILHPNKVSRLKSRLNKLVKTRSLKPEPKPTNKTKKATAKKTASKKSSAKK